MKLCVKLGKLIRHRLFTQSLEFLSLLSTFENDFQLTVRHAFAFIAVFSQI